MSFVLQFKFWSRMTVIFWGRLQAVAAIKVDGGEQVMVVGVSRAYCSLGVNCRHVRPPTEVIPDSTFWWWGCKNSCCSGLLLGSPVLITRQLALPRVQSLTRICLFLHSESLCRTITESRGSLSWIPRGVLTWGSGLVWSFLSTCCS